MFIEPETQEANSFVDSRVKEWRHKFSCDNFNLYITILRIVYTIFVLFEVPLRQMEAFIFMERSHENMYFFCNDV